MRLEALETVETQRRTWEAQLELVTAQQDPVELEMLTLVKRETFTAVEVLRDTIREDLQLPVELALTDTCV